ncbi:MAG TPA: hypothetical protein QGF02_03755 [Candidatus Babeliales bacterium]|nr:hypothetical protein [Candidatus Babeliales bacterium]
MANTQAEQLVFKLIGDPIVEHVKHMAEMVELKDDAFLEATKDKALANLKQNLATVTEYYLEEFSVEELEKLVEWNSSELGTKHRIFLDDSMSDEDHMEMIVPPLKEIIEDLQDAAPDEFEEE